MPQGLPTPPAAPPCGRPRRAAPVAGRRRAGQALRLALAGLLALGVLAARAAPEPAAAASGAGFSLRDDAGAEHRFSAPPQRLVSLLPSLTELVWALDGGPRLVGVDRHSNWPPELDGLPRLGGLEDAQLDAIVRLKPDLILAASAARSLERLEALGFRVMRLRAESHADLRRSLDLLGRLLGRPEAGPAAWARLEGQLQAAAARVPPAWRGRRVYAEVGGGPYAAGPASFIGETLARLGLHNIVDPALGPFPRLNPEQVVRARPELFVGARRELPALARRPGWATLPAVQHAWACGFEGPSYDALVRPGPRLGEAALRLADCLVALDAGPLPPQAPPAARR